MTVSDWQQANTNIALVQSGSAGVDRSAFVIGARNGVPTIHNWDDVRWSLLINDPSYVGVYDDFLGAAINTRWATNLSTGATIAIVAGQEGGVIRFATDTDDDDFATLALGLNWGVNNGYTFFTARVKSATAVTLRAIEIGLSDALSETNGLAFSNHSVAGVTSVADNAVVFGYDTDSSMTKWSACYVNATVDGAVDTGVTVDTIYHEYSIIVDASGNAVFSIDGVVTNRVSNAVATTAVLTPWISLKSLSGAIKQVEVDYIGVAGARG